MEIKLRKDAARVLGSMQGFIATTARSRWDHGPVMDDGGRAGGDKRKTRLTKTLWDWRIMRSER